MRTSNARTSPLVLLCVLTVAPSRNDDPTITTSFAIAGVACQPISPVSRSICWPAPNTTPSLQVDDAVLAEAADRRAVVRVERDQAIAGRDVEDAVVAAAVAPVREPAARQLARRDAGALALAQAVRPHQLAGLPVERDDGPPRAAGGVEHAVDRERRAFQLVLGTRTEDVGLEAPRDLERLEVGGVDLIERRVLRAADVRGVVRPVAGGRSTAGARRRPDPGPTCPWRSQATPPADTGARICASSPLLMKLLPVPRNIHRIRRTHRGERACSDWIGYWLWLACRLVLC